MELILLILTSTIMGALFMLFYLLGIRRGEAHIKEQNHDFVEVNENNQESVKQFLEWINYGGK